MSLLVEPIQADRVIPAFEPHPLLWNGHLQTIVSRYLPGPRVRLRSTYHEVDILDGNRLSVLESVPDSWRLGDPAVVLVHGLAGDVRSPYLARVGLKLHNLGVRVVRMNMRGAGAGYGISKSYYHGGRSEDPRAIVEWLVERAPGSPVAAVGFSLGGNLVLKMAAEAADDPIDGFDCVIAANPPIDLHACCQHIRRPQGKVYDRNFIRLLQTEEGRLRAIFPEQTPVDFTKVQNLFDFDNVYTGPANGFRDAAEYYERSSSAFLIPRIKAPGIVIHAADDPFIPVTPFLKVDFPQQLALELNPFGGHLGYMSRQTWDGDRRWLDSRIVSWLASRWGIERGLSSIPSDDRLRDRHHHGGRSHDVKKHLQ